LKTNVAKNISVVIIAIALVLLVYGTYRAILIVDKTQISTDDGIYTSYISNSKPIEEKAFSLTSSCESKLCEIQSLLDYVSAIPYITNKFQQNSPQKTIQKNYGDCDDKSNLLISMLHALDIEAYFVLVPKHIFVIVPLENKKLLSKKALWVNGKKYYILESTAENSEIGFPLHYTLDEIDTIIEPFSNIILEVEKIDYQ